MKVEQEVRQPFLKWAGNKYRIISRIKPLLPHGKRLIEPFSGSAAVFLNTDYKANLIADTNSDVINLFKLLVTEQQSFIDYCKKYFQPENNIAEKYYSLREEFNNTKSKNIRAALFLYLNKHGYNGLCRYNSSGGFNVPFGKYKNPGLPEKRMVQFIRKSINAEFLLQDFELTMTNAIKGDVIYCDPPYVPLSASNSSFNYEKNGFNVTQQKRLAELAEQTSARGIPVLISNHLTDFTREIYNKASLTTFSVQRQISCKGEQREKAQEVLALYLP